MANVQKSQSGSDGRTIVMKDEEHRKNRLKWMSRNSMVPFDLDFLREIGFEFGLDWDGQLIIEYPDIISGEYLANIAKTFAEGIKKQLYFEGQKAKSVFIGGPLNGQPYSGTGCYAGWPNEPICHHVKRGEWLVYMVKSHDDPRAWFIGTATSKKKAKMLKL